MDQLATSVVGGRDAGAMTKKGDRKERLLQTVSGTSQAFLSHAEFTGSSSHSGTVEGRERGGKNRGGADADGVGLVHRC